VWKAFAKLQGKWFEDIPVVFQNLKFLRPTVLNTEGITINNQNQFIFNKMNMNILYLGTVKFNIDILNGTGNFELLEGGGSLTFSGSINLYTEDIAENQIEHLTMISEKMDLNPDDFYKELRLRGYQYKDVFLGFVEANSEGKIFRSVTYYEN